MKKIYFSIYLLLVCSCLVSNSRVSFTRPGAFMRVSNFEQYNDNTLFSLSLASEVTSFGRAITSHSTSFAYNKTNMSGTTWGFSYTMLPYVGTDEAESNINDAYEFGVHYQTKLYDTGRSVITAGAHDLLLSDDLININDLSFFINFSNTLSSENYTLTSVVGFGSGKIVSDPHTEISSGTDTAATIGVYGAMKLKTPFLKKWGGLDIITEFVDKGINLGLDIPFTREYSLSLGISHLENINKFNNQAADLVEEREALSPDSPAICIGLNLNIPKISQNQTKKIAQEYPLLFINGRVDSSLFNAGEYIYFLQDSLEILKQSINNISAQNIELKLNNNYYRDSLNNIILQTDINSATQNEAMRHLSRSLRFYYQGDFQQALTEVDHAIKLQPSIAIAYARKGSIYYQLNQIDRATLNWNIALKLDPEYSEVREMLNALKDNKLRPVSTD